MFIHNNIFQRFYFAGPADPTGGGGGAAAVAEPPAAQPGSGQGEQGAAANGNFWGMFPDVPEEHRALLEPHIRGMQGHVTRLEQQLSQVKPILESGYNPEQIQGLVQFSRDFDSNPLETWLKIGQALQGGENGQPGVISEDLDLEILAMIATGQPLPDDDGQPGAQQPPVGQESPQNLPPEVTQLVTGLQSRLEAAEGALAQFQQEREADQSKAQQDAQARLLQQQLGTMKKTLTDAGYPPELLEDNLETGANGTLLMRSALIAANGNVQSAIKSLQDQRSAILKGFTENDGRPAPLNPKEIPSGPPASKREPKDGFERARGGAAAFLRRQREHAAQGT